MKWFEKNKAIKILSIVLVVLLILFGVSASTGGGRTPVGAFFASGVSAISGGLQTVATSVHNIFTGQTKTDVLQSKIDELEKENEALKLALIEAKLDREELEDLKALSDALNYNYSGNKITIISGKIASRNNSSWYNEFTINVGSTDGVAEGDTVVTGIGLVGRVEDVGLNWARVLCLNADSTKVSFKLSRDDMIKGICYGDGKGAIIGYMMDSEDIVYEGDVIVTSGIGGYQAGIEIGSIKKITYNANKFITEIVVEPTVEFEIIERVAVIK